MFWKDHHLILFCDDTESVPIDFVGNVFIYYENSPPTCKLFILNIIENVFFCLFFNCTIAINFSLLVMHSREGTCQQWGLVNERWASPVHHKLRMKITVLGATGQTGQFLVNQALQQGHTVTAIVRNPAKLAIHHDQLKVLLRPMCMFKSSRVQQRAKSRALLWL